MLKKSLTGNDARDRGIEARHEQMENGELRFRLMARDGSGYIRTIGPPEGGWQNSHYHDSVMETYIIQKGWVAFVELVDDCLLWRRLEEGDVHTTRAKIAHNVYVPAGIVMHTVKHGASEVNNDWFASADLDGRTKHLSEQEIKDQACS